MKVRRIDTGAVWDLSPEYYERYRECFEVITEPPPKDVEFVTPKGPKAEVPEDKVKAGLKKVPAVKTTRTRKEGKKK